MAQREGVVESICVDLNFDVTCNQKFAEWDFDEEVKVHLVDTPYGDKEFVGGFVEGGIKKGINDGTRVSFELLGDVAPSSHESKAEGMIDCRAEVVHDVSRATSSHARAPDINDSNICANEFL